MTDPMRPAPPIEAGVLVVAADDEKRMVVEALRIVVLLDRRRNPNGGPPASLLRLLRRAEVAQGVALMQGSKGDARAPERPAPIVGGMSVAEVAAALGVTRQAVEDRIKRETLPAQRDSRGRYVIDPADVKP